MVWEHTWLRTLAIGRGKMIDSDRIEDGMRSEEEDRTSMITVLALGLEAVEVASGIVEVEVQETLLIWARSDEPLGSEERMSDRVQ